jgi:hypothetical protein
MRALSTDGIHAAEPPKKITEEEIRENQRTAKWREELNYWLAEGYTVPMATAAANELHPTGRPDRKPGTGFPYGW